MSRIGKLPVTIPEKVTVEVADSVVRVKGPKGELEQRVLPVVEVKVEGGSVIVERKGETKPHRAAHGLTRTLVANMVEGGQTPILSGPELAELGFRVVIFPGAIVRALASSLTGHSPSANPYRSRMYDCRWIDGR